jgi:anthranilate synthase component 1
VNNSHTCWLKDVPDVVGLTNALAETFPFLLDSAASGNLSAHSILMYASGDELVRHADGTIEGPGEGVSFFDRLDNWYQDERTRETGLCQESPDIPFIGGWFLYLSYEVVQEIEPTLRLPVNATGLPDAIARRCPGAIIVFNSADGHNGGAPGAMVTAESPEILAQILRHIEGFESTAAEPIPALDKMAAEEPEKFKTGVRRVLDYLLAGDVFQVNISRLWKGRFRQAPNATDLYQRLRRSSPAPFAGLMHWGAMTLMSSSPERLVQIRGRKVQTRPIAGTRPRSEFSDHDVALSRELIDNVKERAEHIMLIDLERNDLGRVCRPGTVEVDELMVIESYSHVHHIVSNIRGELSDEAGPVQTIKAVFPGGTITGCPKVRCMEIIAELEQEGRGFYTGSMGYLDINGNMDMNILIRSMLLQGQDISFRTGAGIVADSQAEHELMETEHKAKGLLLALEYGTQGVGDA